MASNLTRNEARERARLLTVQSYQVDLDLTAGETTFGSATTVRFTCSNPGSDTFIDLTAPEVTEIVLNGAAVDPGAFDGHRIALTGLAESNELRVVAACAYSHTGEGLHRFTDPADKGVYMYSDLETFDAHQIYACFDQPDLKATFELTVTAQDDWEVISNMAPAGPPEAAGPGRQRWRFPATPLLPTYITAVAAGPYHVVRQEHDGIPLGVFCRQSLAQYLDPDEIFEITRQGFDFYQREFQRRYPFGKYDQLFVPEFKAGAMENAGCVTFLESYIYRSRVTDAARESRASTILHEMAHMWFGDLVTMRWWDDLWLNESFATWASTVAQAEATRWRDAWTTFSQVDKAWAYRQDQLPSTHPIAADIPDIAAVEVNFDGITYAKGAAALKQLVAYVGRDNFLAGVRQYFGEHAWQQRHADRPARRAGAALRPRPGRLVQGLAGDGRHQHAPAPVRGGRRRDVQLVQRAPGGARQPPRAAPAPHRHRPVRPDRRRAAPDPASRARHRRRASPRCPSWSAWPARTWCWSTTTTSPTPRSGSTSTRCAA